MSLQKPQATTDEREAEHKQRAKAHAAKWAERCRHAEHESQTQAAADQTRRDWEAAKCDPHASPDEVERLRVRHVAAETEHGVTARQLQAHVEAHGGLDGSELSIEANLIAQEKIRAAYATVVKQMLQAARELRTLEAREKEILRDAFYRWPEDDGLIQRGANLVPIGFPKAVFTPATTSIGTKSIFENDFLISVAIVFPEFLYPDEATELLKIVEKERADGIFYFAGQARDWHIVQMHCKDRLTLLRGRLRVEQHL